VTDVILRPATEADLPACAAIWREAINDYIVPMGQPEIPDELGAISRLHAHLLATDPERFVVAPAPDSLAIDGFVAAVNRDDTWYLSMLFVRPDAQGSGLGRTLLEHVLPSDETVRRATATDSAQPISNGLYASYGIVPRMPLLDLVAPPDGAEAFGVLPAGIRPVAFEDIAGASAGDDGHRRLVGAVEALDRDVLGWTRPVDHRYLRLESRRGWLYLDGAGEPMAYGYTSEAGRLGPIAARDSDLLSPVLGHLIRAVEPRGAWSVWLPGHADRAVTAAMRAGFRLRSMPVLLCWDRPPADFARYVPISPGLL
jgi:GNAT superfamily N-acetyltransferase